jgi:hypothetical protein
LSARALTTATLLTAALVFAVDAQIAQAQVAAPPLSDSQFQQIRRQAFEEDATCSQCRVVSGQSDCGAAPGCVDRAPEQYPLPGPAPDKFGLLPASFGSLAAAPQMFGDLFGNSMYLNGSLLSLAGGGRRYKSAVNFRALPTDRLFINYNHFNNVPIVVSPATPNQLVVRDQPFDRYTLGVEKTFFNGLTSVDFRAPYSSALDSNLLVTGHRQATEFGNISLAAKVLLVARDRWALSGGSGFVFPTGDDFRALDGSGNEVVRVKNDAVHYQPFLAMVAVPTRRSFCQGLVQVDIDGNGNSVIRTLRGRSRDVGTLNNQTLLYADLAMGFWAYENRCGFILKGIAPFTELHYTSTLNDTDNVIGITNPFNRLDYLNMTGGLHFALGNFSRLSVASVVPLRNNPDRGYDASVGAQLIRQF